MHAEVAYPDYDIYLPEWIDLLLHNVGLFLQSSIVVLVWKYRFIAV